MRIIISMDATEATSNTGQDGQLLINNQAQYTHSHPAAGGNRTACEPCRALGN